ncbi:GNAT family N-acetyltransferase [Ureibacillus manganicus]|uniref:GNAT family N-acetyltransferase n=1 Tax=Ureibacillus manganicus TaxID=1266064 RepID=UPI00068BB412|nr:GNAT family N-acetyltransferase [Ureibacillus manganicus]
MAFVSKKPAENLFIIGDVEVYGFEQDFQKLWGGFNDVGELDAVLLKWEGTYIPYAEGKYDVEGFANIMLADPSMRELSGLKEVVEPLKALIPKKLNTENQFYYAKCTDPTVMKRDEDLEYIQLMANEDIVELVELLKSIPEFQSSNITVESKERALKDGTGKTYFVRVDGKIVSTASTTAENKHSAMVVGVATREDYKRKGYASDIMIKLCKELLAEGKELCLFYDNPEAGKIYKRLGFEDIGFWNMYRFE